MNIIGPFMNQMFLVVVDAYSKWPEVQKMSTTTEASTINALQFLFSAYGLPEQLVSDNGPQFTSYEFKEFLKVNGIAHILSAPYHPSSNGETERMVRIFKEAMKLKKAELGNLNQKMAAFLLFYRSTPHSTTKCTPAELFLGRQLLTRLTLLRPDLRNVIRKKNTVMPSAKQRLFAIGEPVQVRNYRSRNGTWIRGVVVEKYGPHTYKVGEYLWKRHIDQMCRLDQSKAEGDNRAEELTTSEVPFIPRTDYPVSNYQKTGRVEKTSSPESALSENVPKTAEEVRDSTSLTAGSDKLQKDQTLDTQTLEQRYPLRVRTKPKRYGEQC